MHNKGMVDNRMVKDNHQQGIERKKMRPGELDKGQGGRMNAHTKANFKRPNNAMTPRKA